MIQLTTLISNSNKFDDQLVLPFERRQRSRLRVKLASGNEAGLFLPRGTVLRGGDLLSANTGEIVQVIAANEPVMQVSAANYLDLTRAAYHLGNRHVPLQIGDGWLRLGQDHVLQQMLEGLGVDITLLDAPFEPESGAYGGGHHHSDDERPLYIRMPAGKA